MDAITDYRLLYEAQRRENEVSALLYLDVTIVYFIAIDI